MTSGFMLGDALAAWSDFACEQSVTEHLGRGCYPERVTACLLLRAVTPAEGEGMHSWPVAGLRWS